MNQQCKVCGEPAAGFHFGAFTCEGCKSFFGRTNNNQNSIPECKNNGECVINKKNRTSCKACRLKKCLMVGMSKSSSRYGRRSNWFKIHCLLQEQQQNKPESVFGMTSSEDILRATQDKITSPLPQNDPDGVYLKEPQVMGLKTPIGQALPQGYGLEPSVSAAAFWAQAHGSMVPPPPFPGYAFPLHNPSVLSGVPFHPYHHKGFLMPFLPALSPTVPSSESGAHKTTDIGGRRSESSSGCSSEGVSPLSTPLARPLTITPPHVVRETPVPATAQTSQFLATNLVVEKLRSLGPMQDRPLDLSLKRSPDWHSPARQTPSNCGGDDGVKTGDHKEQIEDVSESSPVVSGIDPSQVGSDVSCAMSNLLLNQVTIARNNRTLYDRSKNDATTLLTVILWFSLILFIL